MNPHPGDLAFDALFSDIAVSGCSVSPDLPFYSSPAAEPLQKAPFSLGQNYPNPFRGETTVPFTLNMAADVRLDLLDLDGRKVAGVVRKGRSAGEQSIKLNLSGLGLLPGDYRYQLEITCKHGVFYQQLMMTAV
ncbi:MAG TPA: hypothetical protein VF629_13760 [Hymenobacter sp.]|jgi:hypothetical protein|uniref:hypothetical protein n=1 Tax=Hymenobacter sp. TaxID=1898978 RepID=UPI002ED983AE